MCLLAYAAGAVGTVWSITQRDDVKDNWEHALYATLMMYLWPMYWASRALAPAVDRLLLPPGPGEGV